MICFFKSSDEYVGNADILSQVCLLINLVVVSNAPQCDRWTRRTRRIHVGYGVDGFLNLQDFIIFHNKRIKFFCLLHSLIIIIS